MVNLDIKLNEEDIELLTILRDRKNTFSKDITYEEYKIGNIRIYPEGITNKNYEHEERFFIVEFSLGSHSSEPLIKDSAKVKYTVVYEQILKVLLGKHILVNTFDGERILININS